MAPRYRIAFRASTAESAMTARDRLERRYGKATLEEADCVVALGGDGFMLDTLHAVKAHDLPVYGMNRGSVGFLMNDYVEDDLTGRLADAHETRISPLRMVAHTMAGERIEALAINEVSMLRESRQAAKLRLTVDGAVRLPELICDGVILATPAGSTAYNLSAHGPILPIESRLLALTPISAFRPRRWRGALLPETARVRVEPLEPDKRPVSAVADTVEARDVRDVRIWADRSVALRLLFDPDHGLDERILREQFLS